MGVRRQAGAADLAAEVVEIVLRQAPLEERPGVDAGGGVALEVDLIAGLAVVLAPEEVVEPDLVQAGRRGVGGQVAADAFGVLVGPDHHHGGVPPHVGPDAALDVLVAREPRLELGRDGVHVGGGDGGREADLRLPGPLQQARQEVAGPGLAAGLDDGIEAVQPLLRLDRVDIGELVDEAVEDHASILSRGRLESCCPTL